MTNHCGCLECTLRAIPWVLGARVVELPDGLPLEIHVVSDLSRSPRDVVRDVRTVAMADFGFDVDVRRIRIAQRDPATDPYAPDADVVPFPASHRGSGGGRPPTRTAVAADHGDEPLRIRAITTAGGELVDLQIMRAPGGHPLDALRTFEGEPPAKEPEPAGELVPLGPALSAIEVQRCAGGLRAAVSLRLGDAEFTGEATGDDRMVAIAEATLAALADLLGIPAELQDVQVVDDGPAQVVVAAVELEIPRLGAEIVPGSAVQHDGLDEAAARSVIDAIDGRLSGEAPDPG